MHWTRSLVNLNRLTEYLTMTFLVGMTLLIILQIISRSVLNYSFSWTEELTRYLFIWVVFLGAGIAFRHGAHISIEVFYHKLTSRAKMAAQILITLLSVAFFIALIIKGFEISVNSMTQTSPSLGIPMGYVYIIIPISGVLQIMNLIDVSVQFFKAEPPRKEEL